MKEMKIYAVKIDRQLMCNHESVLIPLVEPERQERIKAYKSQETRQRCLLAGILLKYLLHTEYDIREYTVSYNHAGKPYLPGYENVRFNLSKSGQWVVCALGDHVDVGIDLEQATGNLSVRDWKGIAENVFSKEEIDGIGQLTTENVKLTAYHEYWTYKEAFAKCVGAGLPLYSGYRFKIAPAEAIVYEENRFYFQSFLLDGNYHMCVCSKNYKPPQYYCEVQLIRLMDHVKKGFNRFF